MGEGPLTPFTAPSTQFSPTLSCYTSFVPPEGFLELRWLILPSAGLLPPLRDVSANPNFPALRQQLVVMVSFVGHQFANRRLRSAGNDILICGLQRLGSGVR